MSWYEIQGLFFSLLLSSMLKIAIIIGTLILGHSWIYIERILGFQKAHHRATLRDNRGTITSLILRGSRQNLASWHVSQASCHDFSSDESFVPRSHIVPRTYYNVARFLRYSSSILFCALVHS
jgi:hypothetical protein